MPTKSLKANYGRWHNLEVAGYIIQSNNCCSPYNSQEQSNTRKKDWRLSWRSETNRFNDWNWNLLRQNEFLDQSLLPVLLEENYNSRVATVLGKNSIRKHNEVWRKHYILWPLPELRKRKSIIVAKCQKKSRQSPTTSLIYFVESFMLSRDSPNVKPREC